MKVGIFLVLVIIGLFTTSIPYAAGADLEFGTRFFPSKLVENEVALLQVYAKQGETFVPEKIEGLTVTSLDSRILKVVKIQDNESTFSSEVTVQAVKSGTTKLFLAATGFSPIELPVTVYGNKLSAQQLLLKAVPNSFSSDGPFRGLLAVELADEDGSPVSASEDIIISLTESDSDVIDLYQKNIVIKEGEYFAGTHFTVKDSGKAKIFASTQKMEAESKEISVEEEDLTVKLYAIPDEINISSNEEKVGNIIVQLQDESGDPVIAKKDIQVKYKISSSLFDDINTSNDADICEETGIFTINKGTYWGYKKFRICGGGEPFAGTYDITVSSADPIAIDTEEVKAVYEEFDTDGTTPKTQDGDKFVKFDTLPIFASGNKELIGVVYLEDDEDYHIVADKNLEIQVDSSDSDFLSIEPVTIKIGEGFALVFGTVGHSIPDDGLELNPAVEVEAEDSPQLITAEVFGPSETSLKLTAEPLVPSVLSGKDFPIILYLKDGEEVTNFPKNSNIFVSQSEYFEVKTKPVFRGDDLIILDSKSIGEGTDKLQFIIDDYDVEVTIQSVSPKPASIHIDHSENIFAGTNDVFSLQLLNSQGLPVFATDDIEIKLVVKDESLLQVPESITIKKGDFYTLLDVAPKTSGTTELTGLAEGFPLTSSEIEITSLTPALEMTVPDIIESGEVFVATIGAKQADLPLQGLNVNWNVEGGILQLSESNTGPTGEAIASIISTSDQKVDIEASISSSFYPSGKISKTVRVNSTSEFVAFAEDNQYQQFEKFEIGGIDPIIIIVPAAIIAVGFMMKKKGSLTIKNPNT